MTHLPRGGKLVLCNVEWEDYERLLQELGDSPALRISYSNGRLEVMSSSTKHEKYKSMMGALVLIVCDELELDVVSFGSFTMKLDTLQKGAEADDCFYIQHAAALRGKDEVKMGVDPPPDLVIDVDLTHDSRDKLEIYAALGAPEVWRYEGTRMSVLKLVDGAYSDVEFSLCFPFLSAQSLGELIAALAPGTHRARSEVRAWIRGNKPPAFTSR